MMISRDMLQDIQRFKDCPDTPLHQAAYDGDLAELQLHLKDKNLALKINDRNRLGCSPLRLAASGKFLLLFSTSLADNCNCTGPSLHTM